ncbi:TolC family protein [Erythrobacter sp. NFXS35]|uniref:TolC family protein n=1 Tax=Erythrobacter sp. NFXS35 TaxID=2818436 RepID=UPI0032E006C4
MASPLYCRAQESGSNVYGPPATPNVEVLPADDAPAAIPDGLSVTAFQAVRTYPEVRAAETSIRASAADLRAAEWQRFPSVSVGARAQDDRLGRFSPELRVQQPLWAGGRITAGIQRAEAVRAAAEAQLDETIQDIALRTLTAYYDAVQAMQREAILRASLAEHQRLVESMARRVRQRVSPRSDLELATSRAAQVEQQLGLTVAQRYTALQRLAELTGRSDLELGPLPEYSRAIHHPPTEGAVPQALVCDPTRRRLLAEAGVARAEAEVTEASILPQLSAELMHDRDFGTRFGLVVNAQTNGGLAPFAAADGARLREQASQIQITTAERQLREAVVLDIVENTTAKDTIASSGIAARSAKEVTESFVRQFITGRRTWLDVMNAVRESMTAEMALVDAQRTAMSSAGRLLLRTCVWRPDLTGAAGE